MKLFEGHNDNNVKVKGLRWESDADSRLKPYLEQPLVCLDFHVAQSHWSFEIALSLISAWSPFSFFLSWTKKKKKEKVRYLFIYSRESGSAICSVLVRNWLLLFFIRHFLTLKSLYSFSKDTVWFFLLKNGFFKIYVKLLLNYLNHVSLFYDREIMTADVNSVFDCIDRFVMLKYWI